jgi:hypothetical protein
MTALLLVVTAIPILAQAPRSAQNERSEQVARNSQSNQAQSGPSAQPTAPSRSKQARAEINQNAATKTQNPSSGITPNNDEQAIKVTSAPPISVLSNKDRWDKALVIFTGAIVVVGIFQIVFLWRTVTATKDNAKAALLNAQAVINSERAWIEAELVERTVIGVTRHQLEITNHGKTPAQLSSYEINFGPVGKDGTWSRETLEGKFSKMVRFFLGTGKPSIKLEELDITEMFANLAGASPDDRVGFLCFTINYADVVGAKAEERGHKTCFVYQYDILLGSLERIATFTDYT